MASTSSDLLQEQLCKLHRRLITDIASNIASKSGEGQNFLFHIKEILKDRIYESYDSVPDKIKALEKKNVFGLENYEGLKEICNDSGNLNLIKIIETCEDNMAKIRSEYQHNESSKSSKEEIKRKLSNIEPEQTVEIKRPRVKDSDEQKQQEYEKAKSELRNKILQRYQKIVLKVPAIPFLPKETCEFSQIYVRPTIVTEEKDENNGTMEKVIESMSEIFTKNGDPLKSVYVVGDAGTGKSYFCKYLVYCWCIAHSAGQIVGDKFDGVKEMEKFEFLFFISLRHNQNIDSVHEMLKNQYNIDKDFLGTLLKKESAKIIILLDGLDEWSPKGETFNQFQTMGLPQHDVEDYTIVTTSRPWKIHILEIRDTEIQQMLKLRGFDDDSENEMIKRTVSNLNSRKRKSKNIDDCKRKLQEKSLRSLKQVPIMLQQLICIWFDGKLDKTSRCDVYTKMLELFFTWNEHRTADISSGNTDGSQTVELPAYLADNEMCKLNSHLIYDMSLLAYETLFNCPKEKSLTFDISVFRKLKITDDIRRGCLKLGILKEERYPSLSVSERTKSMFSFIHKSVQEFLAAVNIAINFITKMSSLNNLEDADLQIEFIKYIKVVFKNCSTVNEILEQSNVIIMLCGLEPRLAAHVSKYIYDIVKEDPMVQIYRRTIDSDFSYSDYPCIREIQTLIVDSINECNSCPVESNVDSINECNSCPVKSKYSFCIGDLYIYDRSGHALIFLDYKENCDIVCSSIDQKQIIPDFIHSIFVNNINTKKFRFSEYLPNFKHLEKIIIYTDPQGSSSTENVEDWRIDEVNQSVVETIKINVKSLKSLSLNLLYSTDIVTSLYKEVVCILPSMNNLVAIKMTDVTTSHDDTTRLCKFLEGTRKLEQIHIDIKCECRNQHVVDLSKHRQLQYLDLSCSTCICVKNIDTKNLQIFKFWKIKSTNYIEIFDCFMKCDNLKELELCVDYNNESQSFHHGITERLVSVLPLLHNLSKLNLHSFKLTDNIIKVPSKMKSLKSIDLRIVTMSLTTWRNFVDSLPNIPHTVDVTLCFCHITRDGEEFKVDELTFVVGERVVEGVAVGGYKGYEARQYVKDGKHLFIVGHDAVSWFTFSTRK